MRSVIVIFCCAIVFFYWINTPRMSDWGSRYCSLDGSICLTSIRNNSRLSSAFSVSLYKGNFFHPLYASFLDSDMDILDADELVFDRNKSGVIIYYSGLVVKNNIGVGHNIIFREVISEPCTLNNKKKYSYSNAAKCSFGEFHN